MSYSNMFIHSLIKDLVDIFAVWGLFSYMALTYVIFFFILLQKVNLKKKLCAWWAAVHGVAESGMTELLTHTWV